MAQAHLRILVLALLSIIVTSIFLASFTAQLHVRDDEIWDKAVRQGTLLQQQMESRCYPDIANPITREQLEKLDFQIGSDDSSRWPPKSGILRVFNILVMETMGWTEGMDYWTIECERKFTVRDRTDYFNSFSPRNGLIAGLENRKAAAEMVFWSDLAFALWLSVTTYTRSNIRDLRSIARHEIDNPVTRSIIERAVGPRSKNVRVFERGSQGFKALLGSPNGKGSVFLLMQHKWALGHKNIAKAAVFPNAPFPDVVFAVRDMPGSLGEGVAGANGTLSSGEESRLCRERNASAAGLLVDE